MKRWHKEWGIARSYQLQHLVMVHNWPVDPPDCECEFQTGRFRKGQRGGGCGKPRCQLCKPRKHPVRCPSRPELLSYDRAEEQVEELGLNVSTPPRRRHGW